MTVTLSLSSGCDCPMVDIGPCLGVPHPDRSDLGLLIIPTTSTPVGMTKAIQVISIFLDNIPIW